MNIMKKHLADLPLVYAVSSIVIGGRDYFLAASELEGEGSDCLLLDPDSGRSWRLWSAPGGVMSLIPIPGEEGAFLSIDEFYPVFKSEKASINKTVLHLDGDAVTVTKTEVCKLPFTHRITLLREPDGLFLAAANLCNSKKFVEDWSDPGGLHICEYGEHAQPQTVLSGLTKNHGMYTQATPEGDVLWIGAQEGLVRCRRENGAWTTEFVTHDETSDMWIADIDGDGEDEIAVIQGFHGDEANVLKKDGNSYRTVCTLPIRFGHVIWAGDILGAPHMITASRGGEMELALHRACAQDGRLGFETQIIEKGVGATQIAVLYRAQSVLVCASNHETGTVDLYTITK